VATAVLVGLADVNDDDVFVLDEFFRFGDADTVKGLSFVFAGHVGSF
jgi:hypothetical protein